MTNPQIVRDDILVVENLTKVYGEKVVLADFNLSIPKGTDFNFVSKDELKRV